MNCACKDKTSILGWSVLIGFCLTSMIFFAYLGLGSSIYNIHGQLFGLSKHELDLFMYGFIGFVKIQILVFFLIPWVAGKIVAKSS